MPSFQRLQLTDVIALGSALRASSPTMRTLEDVAARMVSSLYDMLTEPAGDAGSAELPQRVCALARLFLTQRYDQLDPEVRAFADRLLGDRQASPSMPCLVLVASRGVEPAWNSPRTSAGHRAIPLPDRAAVEGLPMIAEMLRQLGVEVEELIEPSQEAVRELRSRSCGVFLVPDAEGSPLIPAQDDFVRRYGIRSVLGFGGVLPAGELFVALLFTRTLVSRDAADSFAPLALSMNLGLLSRSGERIFS